MTKDRSLIAGSVRPRGLFGLVLALALATAGLTARQAGDGGYPLMPTAHPPVPTDPALYWFVPPPSSAPPPGVDAAAVNRLSRGVRLVGTRSFTEALALVSPTGLAGSPLEHYASYYTAVAQMGLGRYDEALLVLSLLAARPLDGALRELVPLRMAEAALAVKAPERAEGALVELTADKLANPGQVWLMRGRVEEAVGRRVEAVDSYRRLFYDYPLAEEAQAASEALARLSGTGRLAAELVPRALARAERLFAAKRWSDARTAFAALQGDVTGAAAGTVALRLAELEHFLGNRRGAREALAKFFDDSSRAAEARYHHLAATKALGDKAAFVGLARKLAAEHPDTPWAEQALNDLATHFVTIDADDEADAVFRQLLQSRPRSTASERAAWKVGWRSYRSKDYADAASIFEAAASLFPRADNRPAWLYWAGRARDQMGDQVTANARFRLVVVDYQNSYYGRLASGVLKERGEVPTVARITGLPTNASIAAVESTADTIRALVGAQMDEDALREVEYAQRVQGDSPRLQATAAWIRHRRGFELTAHERFAALRGAITTMRRAYPQFMAAGGETLPPDVLRVIFPLDYWPLITKYADQYKLDRFLIAALMAQESTFTAEIRSYANAYGLMQVIPSTGRIYARKLGIAPFSVALLKQPETNVRIGTRYFSDLIERFGGAHFALASYNAGEGRVAVWAKNRPGVPQDEFIDDIPFPQTQTYVKRILGTAEDYRYLYGSGLVDPNAGPSTMVVAAQPASPRRVSAPSRPPSRRARR